MRAHLPGLPQWVNRVAFAMSALVSAIHDTGHFHVQLGQVRLSPSYARICKSQATAPNVGLVASGRVPRQKSQQNRLKTRTESVLMMLFPIFS
jgi:hypothetical protein